MRKYLAFAIVPLSFMIPLIVQLQYNHESLISSVSFYMYGYVLLSSIFVNLLLISEKYRVFFISLILVAFIYAMFFPNYLPEYKFIPFGFVGVALLMFFLFYLAFSFLGHVNTTETVLIMLFVFLALVLLIPDKGPLSPKITESSVINAKKLTFQDTYILLLTSILVLREC